MARANLGRYVLNRGRVSKLALGRVDLDRTRLMAEIQTNFVPRTLGSMMLRPGFQYIGTINNSSTARLLPFVFSATDAAILELTSTAMRVWIDDAIVIRTASTSSITNGSFSDTALTGWTDADETGTTSGWLSTGLYSTSTGFLTLVGTRYARAKRRQAVTALAGTYGLSVRVDRGPVNLRVGSSTGGDDYITETSLRTGHYSLSLTTTGTFYIELSGNTEYSGRVKSITIESSGNMVLDTTWSGADLGLIRYDQSADIMFVANSSYPPKMIERHAAQSWAVRRYEPEDGPFRAINITNTQITPTGRTGAINLPTNNSFFTPAHVGALVRITSVGQAVSVAITTANQFSEAIRVSGVSDGRKFQILVTSSTSWVATAKVQRSIREEGSWADVSGVTFTSTIDSTHNDSLDNQIAFYRIGVGSTFTSGTLVCQLSYASGGLTGVARIATVPTDTPSAAVLTSLGSTNPTELWEEGEWSNYRGWPSAVALHEGRLWWAGKGKIWGSVSDAYESFDPDEEGDAGPINRAIGSGGVDEIPWLSSLGRLIVGTDGRELQAKTGSLDEPLTPSNFNLTDVSNQD